MDIPRAPLPNRRRFMQGGVAVAAVVLVTVLVLNLSPAAPAVDRASLWVDSVRRGEMVSDVRGPGTLVSEHIRFITAVAGGRVDRVLVEPGQHVRAETVLLELSNPDVQIQALQAEQALTAAQAQLVSLRTNLETQQLSQSAVVATTRTDYEDAKRHAAAADTLAGRTITANDAALARDKAIELAARYDIEQQRLRLMRQAMDSQLAVQRSQVERLRAIAQFQQRVVRSLKVLAGDSGVVSDLTLQLGQYVVAGTVLARVVQPGKLKAVLRIPETQATDLAIGQAAAIDTRNGIIPGHVTRIDPNALNGTVAVDVTLDGTGPGVRPDVNVDGRIEIERLEHALYTGRPAYAQPHTTIELFRVSADGQYATRVGVQVGRGSASSIEVLQGLTAGDSVILSDMTQWSKADRVRLRR